MWIGQASRHSEGCCSFGVEGLGPPRQGGRLIGGGSWRSSCGVKMQVFVISKSTNSCCFIFQFASSTMHSRESSILLLGAEHVDVIGRCLLVCRDRSPIYTTLQYRILVSSKYCFLPSRCGCSCANAILLISCGVFRTSNAVILRRYLEVCPGVSSYLLTCRPMRCAMCRISAHSSIGFFEPSIAHVI